MLSAALRHLDEHGRPDDRVYAVEGPGNTRQFKVMSAEDVWNATSSAPAAHFYEVLTGPCNMYLDVEWYSDSVPEDERAQVVQIIDHVQKSICETYEQQVIQSTIVSASGWSKGKYKCSWHIHMSCKNICWVNTVAVGQFVKRVCAHIPEVDKIPYSSNGQNWRCVGSSKRADPTRVFQPANYSTFHACTVQQNIGDRSLVYPTEAPPAALETPVPDYILKLASTLRAGGTPRMCGADRCVVPFRERQWCEHVRRKHHSNHQYAVISLHTLMWKMNCHACTDQISAWRTFEDVVAVREAFQKQQESYISNTSTPAVRFTCCTAPTTIDLLTHGPPPIPYDDCIVQCIDGFYHKAT